MRQKNIDCESHWNTLKPNVITDSYYLIIQRCSNFILFLTTELKPAFEGEHNLLQISA